MSFSGLKGKKRNAIEFKELPIARWKLINDQDTKYRFLRECIILDGERIFVTRITL